MTVSPAVVAGAISTTLFAVSHVPMLVKAFRSKDLTSYSLSNLVLTNVANAIHSIYVWSLPVGPVWLLHCFYLVSSALMLLWHRTLPRTDTSRQTDLGSAPAPGRRTDVRSPAPPLPAGPLPGHRR